MESHVPTIDELIELPSPGDPQISPDGNRIAYTLRKPDWKENKYITQIWSVSTKAGEPHQLTFSPKHSSYSPRWSPDGQWIVFLSKRREDERPQIYRISISGGEAERLTDTEGELQALSWSPDGKWIAYLAYDPQSETEKKREEKYGDFFIEDQDDCLAHLWLLKVEDRKLRKLTSGKSFHVTGFKWAPGSDRIAFEARPTSDERDWDAGRLYTVDISTLEVITLTEPGIEGLSWSPDGSMIAFLRLGTPTYYTNGVLCTVSSGGGEIRALSSGFDESPWIQDWGPEGIYYLALKRTSHHMFCIDPNNGRVRQITPDNPEGWVIYEARFSSDFHRAGLIQADSKHYSEVCVLELDSGEFRRLSSYNDLVKDWELGSQQVFQWKSTDGIPLEGILTTPPDFNPSEKHPLLVVIHGGPAAASLLQRLSGYERFIYPTPLWVAKGALLLQPNYRGSGGYGEKFRALNVRNLGVGDAMDILSGVDALVEKGWVDPLRVGAMGWSQGGYISAFLTTSCDRFKAISVGAGISNWVTYYVNTDIHPFTRQYLGASPWDDPGIYGTTSPMTYIKNAKTPTLIQHGEFDTRVPTPNAYELYQGLQDMGVETKLVIYRGMGHGISLPRLNRQVAQENLEWFNRWIWDEKLSAKETASYYVAVWRDEWMKKLERIDLTTIEELAMRRGLPFTDVIHWSRRDGTPFRLFVAPSGLLEAIDPLPENARQPQLEEISMLASRIAVQLKQTGARKLVLYTSEVEKDPTVLIALGCLQVAAGIAGGCQVDHCQITEPGW